MGMRGAKHRFMPNRLVFPGGRVDRADLTAPSAAPLSAATEFALRKKTNPRLAHGLAAAAARELLEETGLSLGSPPRFDGLHYLARAVTPPGSPIRFNARFLVVEEKHVSGELGGDGELEGLRFYGLTEALGVGIGIANTTCAGAVAMVARSAGRRTEYADPDTGSAARSWVVDGVE